MKAGLFQADTGLVVAVKVDAKTKKKKYLDACLERRRSFKPLVFSVNGLPGKETAAACRRLFALLSKK